ncbi:MAG: glycosyltransferase [Gammaproteobacteria bacterium]|nr:glycosyltransferase [Gammaproteobacteria bacterium]
MPKHASAEQVLASADLSIAVAIPCLNEAATIASVVDDFHAALTGARVYVYDNASTDDTFDVAAAAGAIVRREPERGKGNVVRRAFGDLDADVVVLVDGDGTYPAHEARRMVATLVEDRLDMVVGARLPVQETAFPRGHRLGNRLITAVVGAMFGRRFRDTLSGYRVLSRRFAKSFPAQTGGFEVETEMTVHALATGMPATELEVAYAGRPAGSRSKLRTVPDGIAIARTIMVLVKEEKPLAFFALVGGVLELAAGALAWPLLPEYLETGLVPRLPTAVLSTGLALLGALSFACGLVLDTVTRGRRESRRLHYLALPTPPEASRPPGQVPRA